MSSAGVPAQTAAGANETLAARESAIRNDFAAAHAASGSNYDWILNAGAGNGAGKPAGGPPGSQQGAEAAAAPGTPSGAKPAAAPPAGSAQTDGGHSGPFMPDPSAPFGIQIEQSLANVWKSMQAESGAAAEQLRADLLPKNLAELKANLLRYGADPLAMAAKLGLDTSGYVFSPVAGAAKQLVGAPVQAATGSKTAGEAAGNAAAAAAGMIGGPAGEEGALARAAGEAESAVSGETAAAQAAEASRALPKRTPFAPDFPAVVIQQPADSDIRLVKQPDYKAAKSGDPSAALNVVSDMIDPQAVDQLRLLIGDRKPVIVAVHAQEASGKNALPQAYARVLGDDLGLERDTDIVQANSPQRTGKSAIYRLTHPVEFDGPVVPGQDYLLADDFVTQGGTLADLKGYIESRGGNVIGATALAGARDSEMLAPGAQTLYDLRQRFPDLDTAWKERFGHALDGLTESEGQQLLQNFKSTDDIRDRVLASPQEGRGPQGGRTFGAAESAGEPGEPGQHGETRPGAANADAGGEEGVEARPGAAAPQEALAGAPANENRVFDIAGESPGAALNVTPEMRARAATYIAGGEASSPFELHLDQFAKDPVGAVSDLANVIPKDSVKPVDATRMNAYSLNLSPEEVMAAIRPKMPSDEVFDAAAMAVRSAGEQFWNAARKAVAPDATYADMEEAIRAYTLANQFTGAMRDAKMDWGRAGRIQQEAAASFGAFDQAIQKIIADARESRQNDIEQVVRRAAELDDPRQVSPFVSSLRWMGTKEGLLFGWYNWLLSNPGVVVKKIATDMLTAGINLGTTYAAEKFGSGAVRNGETGALLAGYLGSFSDAMRAAWRGLKAGESQFMGDARTLDGLQRSRISALANGMDQAPAEVTTSPTLQAMRFLRSALPTSWMGAADDFGKTFNYRAIARQLLYRQGVEQGLSGDMLADHVSQGLNNIAPDIHAQAVQGALRNTFTEPMAPVAQAIQDAADKLSVPIAGVSVPIPLGRIIAPFMRIGANATRFAYLHSPLPLALPSGGFKAAIAAGGASRDLAYARVGLGTGAAAIVALLSSGAGGMRMTGRGPADPEMQRRWRDAGNEPYSIKIGDRWFGYGRVEPIATHFGAIADTADILRYARDQDAAQLAWSTIFGIGTAMTSRSYNQGIANFLEALHDPNNDAERYGANLVGSMAMPPGANAIKQMFDPWLRSHYHLLDAVEARTPGYSQSMPPQRNLWGQAIRSQDGFFPGLTGTGVARAFSPVTTAADQAQPIDKWIWDNREAFPQAARGRVGLSALAPTQSFRSGKLSAPVQLTPQQLDRLRVAAGDGLKDPRTGMGAMDTLNALATGKYPDADEQAQWNAATPEARALKVLSIYNSYKRGAQKQLLAQDPQLLAAVQAALGARQQQLTPAPKQANVAMPHVGGTP